MGEWLGGGEWVMLFLASLSIRKLDPLPYPRPVLVGI